MMSYPNEVEGDLQQEVLILRNGELLFPGGQKKIVFYKIVGSCMG